MSRTKLVIGLDLDDVLAMLIPEWLLRYNRLANDHLTENDIRTWEISDHVKPEWKTKLFELLTPAMYDAVQPYEGTVRAVQKIREMGHEVWIVTSCHSNELWQAKIDWLDKVGYEYDDAYGIGKWATYKRKQDVPGLDWLVDDHIGNLVNAEFYPVLQTRPHNRLLDWTGKRIKHLSDIIPHLENYQGPKVAKVHITKRYEPVELLKPAGFIGGIPVIADESMAKDKIALVPVNPSIPADLTQEYKVVGLKETNPKDAIGAAKVPLNFVSGIVKAYAAVAHYLGNVKYGAWNYRAGGARASVYLAALQRHMDRWTEGQELDPVDGTPHLANALACINILIEAHANGNLVDDRPPSRIDELERAYAQVEATMVKIRERYADKDPRHYTIADR